MKIGDKVVVKNGASQWMKEHNFWLNTMPNSIDGNEGAVTFDYTDLEGDYSHFAIDLRLEYNIGIHPQWLELI